MGLEIERKFLVDGDGWRAEATEATVIRQGYLVRGEARTVRVRRRGDAAYLTIKGPGDRARQEFEYEIPAADADELLALCEPGVIDKVRHLVPFRGRVWEVDVFGGRHEGLVLAEVELDDAGSDVDVPEWVGREVTGEPGWSNAELSRP